MEQNNDYHSYFEEFFQKIKQHPKSRDFEWQIYILLNVFLHTNMSKSEIVEKMLRFIYDNEFDNESYFEKFLEYEVMKKDQFSKNQILTSGQIFTSNKIQDYNKFEILRSIKENLKKDSSGEQ